MLSYRWLEVELGEFMWLLANPPGPTLDALRDNLTADPVLTDVLSPLGFMPFGKRSGANYDPVCFDTRRRLEGGDCPVVQIEHEAVLCNRRVGEWWEIASSFRGLVEAVIDSADRFGPANPATP